MLPKNQNRETFTVKIAEYEQHGRPNLVAIYDFINNEYHCKDINFQDLKFKKERLFIPQQKESFSLDINNKDDFLIEIQKIESKIDEAQQNFNIEKIWESVQANFKNYQVSELLESSNLKNDPINCFGLRRAIISNNIYFKRDRNEYAPRNKFEIQLLKIKGLEEQKSANALKNFCEDIINKKTSKNYINNCDTNIQTIINNLIELAAKGKNCTNYGDYKKLVQSIEEQLNRQIPGSVLEKARHILHSANLLETFPNFQIIKYDRNKQFDVESIRAAETSSEKEINSRVDFSELETFSIDNAETEDVDDAISWIQSAEGYELYVHITDVSSYINKGDILFKTAQERGTTTYYTDGNQPMLPYQLSTDKLSLLPGRRRTALTYIYKVNSELKVTEIKIKKSIINVNHKLSYTEVDESLSGNTPYNNHLDQILLSLWNFTSSREAYRLSNGAHYLEKREKFPQLDSNGLIKIVESDESTPAHKLVAELMILVNETTARFAESKNIPMIFRTQEEVIQPKASHANSSVEHDNPATQYKARTGLKRSDLTTRAGKHAGLGISSYLQITSPLRRFSDLVNQIQFSSYLTSNEIIFERRELEEFIPQVQSNQEIASQIQKERNRFFINNFIYQEHKNDIDNQNSIILDATVVNLQFRKNLIELELTKTIHLFDPSFESSANSTENKLKPGDKIKVKIVSNDPYKEICKIEFYSK